jgi:hypothetical protein
MDPSGDSTPDMQMSKSDFREIRRPAQDRGQKPDNLSRGHFANLKSHSKNKPLLGNGSDPVSGLNLWIEMRIQNIVLSH